MPSVRLLLPAALLLVAVTGCGSARLIRSTPDGGVVAIPSNSDAWPFHYRREAEKLMAQKCPNGYDVVEEREVVVGKTSSTGELVDRTSPSNNSSSQQTTLTKVTTVTDQTEYRITFRARDVGPVTASGPVLVPISNPPPQPAPPGLPSRPVPVTTP